MDNFPISSHMTQLHKHETPLSINKTFLNPYLLNNNGK